MKRLFENKNRSGDLVPQRICLYALPAVLLAVLITGAALAGNDALRFTPDGVIIDQAGRHIRVRRPFTRIISLYGAHTENLFSLGMETEIIGVSRHEAFPPEAAAKPVFSYHDDPEKFMAARPDLVLIRAMIDRGYPQLVRRLEQSGITVISLQPGNIPEMYVYWDILGALCGRRAAARQMINTFQKQIAQLRQRGKAVHPKKRVYFEAIHKRMKTFTPDSMAIFVLQTAGGVNIAGDARPVRNTNIAFYGRERILTHADEIDGFIAQYGAMNRPTVSMIENEPGFSVIKAIQNGQILIIDEMIVSRPTMRLISGVHKIGSFLYPEVFTAKEAHH